MLRDKIQTQRDDFQHQLHNERARSQELHDKVLELERRVAHSSSLPDAAEADSLRRALDQARNDLTRVIVTGPVAPLALSRDRVQLAQWPSLVVHQCPRRPSRRVLMLINNTCRRQQKGQFHYRALVPHLVPCRRRHESPGPGSVIHSQASRRLHRPADTSISVDSASALDPEAASIHEEVSLTREYVRSVAVNIKRSCCAERQHKRPEVDASPLRTEDIPASVVKR